MTLSLSDASIFFSNCFQWNGGTLCLFLCSFHFKTSKSNEIHSKKLCGDWGVGWNIKVYSHRMIIFWMAVRQMPWRRYNHDQAQKTVLTYMQSYISQPQIMALQSFINHSLDKSNLFNVHTFSAIPISWHICQAKLEVWQEASRDFSCIVPSHSSLPHTSISLKY